MVTEIQDVMTLSEVAVYLRIAQSTVYKLSREGAMPAQKLGKQWRYHKSAIDGWLAGKATSTIQSSPNRKAKLVNGKE